MITFIHVPVTLDAAAGEDSPRTITGIAVPWDTVATVLDGTKVSFNRGAFDTAQKSPKLIENHDMTQLRGTVTELVDSEEGLLFTAKFAKTNAANDAIELVKAGAYDSVSVGAVPTKFKFDKNGVMRVTAADLVEISLVAQPAFKDAVITEIAASEPEADETPNPDDIPEEEPMSEITPVVEAEAPAVVPTAPIHAQVRGAFKLPSASDYIAKFLAGGAEFAEFNARVRAAAPDVVTTGNDGVLPEMFVLPVYSSLRGLRPVIDAIGTKAMPQGGKVFIRPKVTTHTTIGASNGENVALDAGTFEVDQLPVTKGVFGGYVQLSEELQDWSDPSIVSLILDDMAREYAKQTDLQAASDMVVGTTNSNNFANASITDPTEWVRWVYQAAADILTGSNGWLPSHLFVSPNIWQYLGQLSDGADRPLFPQVGPMNAFGTMTPGTASANAFGLTVVVDANLGATDMIIADPSGFEIFEQQKGALSVEAADGSLSRYIKFRGYLATLMIDDTKFIKAAFV